MNDNKGKTYNAYQLLFRNKYFYQLLFTSIAVAVLVTLFFTGNLEVLKFKKQTKNQLIIDAQNQIDDLHEKITFLNSIFEVDEHFFNNENNEKTLEKYHQLLKSDSTNVNLLKIRIQYVQELISNQYLKNDHLKSNNKEILSLNNQLNSLKVTLNQLTNLHNQKSDSLQDLILELQTQIQLKDNKINEKDRIKVITFKNEKGNTIHYLGEVIAEKANGGGIGIWSTGSIYKGNWKNNFRHGKGIFQWKDGEKYEGDYVNDKREGKGSYIWLSGEKYDGEWVNDKRNGNGILYDFEKNIRYEGVWEDDKPKNN